jgi:hypothetical protein
MPGDGDPERTPWLGAAIMLVCCLGKGPEVAAESWPTGQYEPDRKDGNQAIADASTGVLPNQSSVARIATSIGMFFFGVRDEGGGDRDQESADVENYADVRSGKKRRTGVTASSSSDFSATYES